MAHRNAVAHFTWLGELTCIKATSHTLPSIHVTQLPALGVPTICVFYYMYNWTISFLLASTNPNVLLGKGTVKVFTERLGLRNVFPYAAFVQIWLLIIIRWQVYHLVRLVAKVIRFHDRGLHPFTKISEAGQDYSIDLTSLLSGRRHVSI